MDRNKKIATIVGSLFIIATIVHLIGEAFSKPFLSSLDYLDIVYPNRISVVFGSLIELISIPAVALIPVFLFPIFKKHNEPLALGYVGFRFFEGILFTIISIKNLSLISLSQEYLTTGGVEASYFQNIGRLIQAENSWMFMIYLIVFTSGALIFYSVLYRSKLVPRFLSGWGFIGAALMLTGTVLSMFEINQILGLELDLVLILPIAVNEIVVALWLIVKGFNPRSLSR